MILPVIFVLLVLSAVLLFFRWRRGALAFLVLPILLLVVAGLEPLPRWLIADLDGPFIDQAPPEWAASNAIVVLGSGTLRISDVSSPDFAGYGRVAGAAAYRACIAEGHRCTIVASGGSPRGQVEAEADVMTETLIGLGVPASDILRENESNNTFENARLTRALLSDKNFERIFLVTSSFHMERSLLYFAHFGIVAQPLPVFMLEPAAVSLPVTFNIAMTDVVLHEYTGLLRYDVYNALGWNEPPVTPILGAATPSSE